MIVNVITILEDNCVKSSSRIMSGRVMNTDALRYMVVRSTPLLTDVAQHFILAIRNSGNSFCIQACVDAWIQNVIALFG